MKKLINASLVAMALFTGAMAATAAEPVYAAQTVATTPATIATLLGTNYASYPVIDVRKQQNVMLTFSFNQASASESNVVYWLVKSPDASNWDLSQKIVVVVPSTGATRVNWTTNLFVGGAGYLGVYAISNTTALTTMTNFGITYGVKISAP